MKSPLFNIPRVLDELQKSVWEQNLSRVFCVFYSRTGLPLRVRVPISPGGVPEQTSILSAVGTVPLSTRQCCTSSVSSREVFKEVHLLCHSNVSDNMMISLCFFSFFIFPNYQKDFVSSFRSTTSNRPTIITSVTATMIRGLNLNQ